MSTLILLARESYGSERYVVGDENREVEERLNRSFACGGDDDDRFRCGGGGSFTATASSTQPPFTSSSSLPPTGPDLDALISFWHDPAIKQLWSERHLIRYSSLKDRTDFALNNMQNYALNSTYAKSGKMTDYEISLATTRTIGLKEVVFGVPDGYPVLKQRRNEVSIVDAGGQRMERKKWPKLFHSLPNAILLVRSLTEYAYVLFEDETVNRFEESRRIGNELINNQIWIETPVFVILNKYDEFCEMINTIPFGSKVLDYHGPNEPNAIIQWICDDIRMGMSEGGSARTTTIASSSLPTTSSSPTTTSSSTTPSNNPTSPQSKTPTKPTSKSSTTSTSTTRASSTTISTTTTTFMRQPHNLIFLPPMSAHNPQDCNTMFDAVMSRVEADEVKIKKIEEEDEE